MLVCVVVVNMIKRHGGQTYENAKTKPILIGFTNRFSCVTYKKQTKKEIPMAGL